MSSSSLKLANGFSMKEVTSR